ncbi:MAG: subtilase-type protease inhibitor [Actinomycetota bacterium]|nr:subtilase-type protease inhibitor [Actinomycetota bacterium]
MRWIAVTAAAVAAAFGCGSASSAPSETAADPPATSLTITFWEAGKGEGPPGRWTLRCGPVGGSHPRAAAACTRLAALKAPFKPLRDDLACTQVYGGPEEALVTGTHRGKRVWMQLSLRDGCQIARFRQLAFLVPWFSVREGRATR